MTTFLKITARRAGGFRRAGRRWPATATEVPAAAFTPKQRAALEADPNLVVAVVERSVPEGAAPAAPVGAPEAPAADGPSASDDPAPAGEAPTTTEDGAPADTAAAAKPARGKAK